MTRAGIYLRWLTVGVFVLTGLGFAAEIRGAQPDAKGKANNEQTAEAAADFSTQAVAIPFPPDAREVEFHPALHSIRFKSGLSLGGLEDFYRRTMRLRGWIEKEAEAEGDDESAKLKFEHEGAGVVVRLDVDSDEGVNVRVGCKGLDFEGTDDPAVLMAAGIPQPESYEFLQSEIPRPERVQDVEYCSGKCCIKSAMTIQEAIDFYGKALKELGWQESHRPIITDHGRDAEFKKGEITVSVHIFSIDTGVLIVLGYENPAQEAVVPRLAEVDSSRTRKRVDPPDGDGDHVPDTNERVVVDVSTNHGSSSVTLGDCTSCSSHVAAFQTKKGGDTKTTVVFAGRTIPMQRLQAMLVEKEDFRFEDLFESDMLLQLTVEVGAPGRFSFNEDGVEIAGSVDEAESDLKVEAGRVRGNFKMAQPKRLPDGNFEIVVTVDVAVLTPNTKLGEAVEQPKIRAKQSPFAESSELLLPEGAGNARSEGSQYTKSTRAEVDLDVKTLEDFYRQELTSQGWGEVEVAAGDASENTPLVFKKTGEVMTVAFTRRAERTSLRITLLDDAKAQQDGILPEAGKGRLVMSNSHSRAVVIAIGKNRYTLKANRGAKDPKQALNYTVAPGTYHLEIKVPGKPSRTVKLDVGRDTTWGVSVLPTGEYLANQLYGSKTAEDEP